MPSPPAGARYAAIYYDVTTRAIGISWGYGSDGEAKQVALKSCRDYGGRNCEWAASGPNVCLALATSTNGPWGPAIGNYPETAKAKAIAVCRKNGGIDCQVPAAAHPCSGD